MGRVMGWNPWRMDAEPGDIMVNQAEGKAYRLEQSSSRNRRDAGELYPREIKKPGHIATLEDGKLVWKPQEQTP